MGLWRTMSTIISSSAPDRSAETRGLLYGFLGVAIFSLSLPATRLAVAGLDPLMVGLGRSLAVAPLAALLLWRSRTPWPKWSRIPAFALVVAGVIVGFPVFSAMAMTRLPASHGAVLLGIMPLATAMAGTLRAGDRPSLGFWLAGLAGSALVIGYAIKVGAGRPQPADGLLLLAVAAAALGYAEGGRLAQILGGWQVICWALVLAAPLLAGPVAWLVWRHGASAEPSAWAGFAYVALFSQFIGFFFWYKGLALGGIARVSQIQFAQLFLTLAASALFLGEHLDLTTIAFGIAVAVVLVIGRRMPVRRRANPSPPDTDR
jgi:drug/metabolite transporter (DMT)-like permease